MTDRARELNTRIIRSSVDWSCAGLLLADMLAGRFTYRSKAEWCQRIESGEITVNALPARPEQPLQLHDIIEYRPGDIVEPAAQLDYRVVFEDESLLVIDKPGNLCMHPAGPFFKNTLWHLLATTCGDIHFLNRLDRETSGLLLAAKNGAAAAKINKKKLLSAKNYLVLVHGSFTAGLTADGFLTKGNSIVRKKRTFSVEMPSCPPFESASTTFTPLGSNGEFSLLAAELHTGRMHQIRATLASLGYPVVGDKLYGVDERLYLKQKDESFTPEERAKLLLSRQALHSAELSFIHPVTGEKMSFSSPLPAELELFAKQQKLI